MKDLITNIQNTNQLEANVEAFSLLSKQSKLDTLEKMREIRTEAIGNFLNRIYASERDKQVQKIIKKLLFRLKTSGVKVEELRSEGESVLKRIEEKREYHGLMSNYDSDGSRMAMVAFERKRNSYILVHGLIHFSKGLLELANAPVDGNGLKNIIAEYLKGSLVPFTVVEVAPRYASYLIEEASNRSGRYLEEIKQMKFLSNRLGGQVGKPADIYNLDTPDGIDTLPPERILGHQLFDHFSLTWDAVDEDKKFLNEIGSSSTIVLPPYMAEEKRQAFLKALTEDEKIRQNLPLIKRLMEDYAYIFHCLGEFGAYKGLVELLLQTDGPKDILTYFVRKVLEQKDEQQPGLIVNPYEQVRTPR